MATKKQFNGTSPEVQQRAEATLQAMARAEYLKISAAFALLKPHLGTIESALREYSSNSRDVDEKVDASRALAAVANAQKVAQ